MEEKELDNIPQEISEEEEINAPKGEGIKDVKEGIQGGIDDVEMAPIVKESFLDYAMSVIVSRALPDARDGFKPVQRRIIYGMSEAGMTPDKPFKKSARIVGDVMGKYHPHGDSSIYLAMARLAQDFAVRYPLVEGHGNYGSQDGDEPAASRYTEARMAKIALEMVKELGKETVKFIPTYDSDGEEPEVLPSRIPNLLINGSSGIAVGMATNIPPHNLKETISGAQALLKNPELTPFDLMQYIHGPDFPGGGTILGRTGIKNYFEKGQGSIRVRGKYNLVENNGKTTIVFTEVPYMVNKKELAKKIIELVDSKTLEGISAINDYSSHKMGTRFEIELKKGANVEIVLNHLFKYTKLQDSFAVNMLALDNGAPKILNMKQALNIFNKFQCELVEKRTRYNLAKAQDRLHILEGLLKAIDNIDDIVKIIKESSSTEEATNSLIAKYGFSDKQVKAILDMNLRRLVGLERDKILKEDGELKADIAKYNLILSDVSVLHQVVYDELEEIKNKYGDDRRTSISDEIYSDEDEDLIADEEILIMQTTSGYIKRLPPSTFKTQNRGGVGVIGMTTKDEDDIVDILAHSRTKTDVLF
ncbi:MAG: DNA topoisomerase (ATP-hydrolyzing), partial [Bacilli bacterium]|nr:DNA topoisomerase (ATP-hydrolyzing) [Bacilli bacterium]